MNRRLMNPFCAGAMAAVLPAMALAANAGENFPALESGKRIEILFTNADLPPTLYSMMNGGGAPPCVTFRLPDHYSATNTYPLVLYVPGNDGNPKGNMDNAEAIAPDGWIAATVPLFKKSVDANEPFGGVIVSFEDYPVLSRAYRVMLGRLFETVPNIDAKRSAMVGFSNGAITTGILVSCHDEFILSHFRNFCLVDQGMFHLSDLHKSGARESKFLFLVGDQPEMGRDVKLRQAQLQQDAWKLLGVDVTYRVMTNTGHEFFEPQMAIVRNWLTNDVSPVVPVPVGSDDNNKTNRKNDL